jgi:excisionase family DNA binding protein
MRVLWPARRPAVLVLDAAGLNGRTVAASLRCVSARDSSWDRRARAMSTESQQLSRKTPVEQLPEFLTPEELTAYLQLSRNTVYELLRTQQIQSVRFGRTIRIPKSALSMNAQKAKMR